MTHNSSPQHQGERREENNGYQGAKIRAQGARYGAQTLLISAGVLLVLVAVIKFRPGEVLLAEIFILSASLVGVLVGFLKLREPFYSIYLDKDKLSYNHKYGCWQLAVSNLARVGVVQVHRQGEVLDLNVIGICLRDEDKFLQRLSPRLAGRLLVEQRHFLMQAIKAYCQDGKECPPHWLVEDTDYVSEAGCKYTGLLAMFANRMNNLKLLTGYHLLLPAAALDRDIWTFSYMLHRWQQDPELTVSRLRRELSAASGSD
ncbi:DUF2982 domain-containing protein [Pseudoalteromonas sp. T1lg22]|uniref:DUF2982 domain-containing protein n=1 Tax=Pseudoalteromonas sp. T1lg22 TaxID=2077096 RepID=UPI000CF5FA70|nr:DUF2982 domain-containing protein [Pseudoalteromonas sp. T1lg22]